MLESERIKLFDPKREYLNLGISDGGAVYSIIPVFWESSAGAFSMKTPDVFIAPEDLSDKEIMDRVFSLTVHGLYVYAPLEDYSFIAKFPELWDIHIERAEGLTNLDFLSEMHDCAMIFLASASLSDIDVIRRVKEADKGIVQAFRYVCLYDCNIEKIPDFSNTKCRFTELIIWSRAENSESDRERFSAISATTKKYFVIKPKNE